MRILFIIIGCTFFLANDKKQASPRKIIDVHFHAHLSTDYPSPPPANAVTGKTPGWKNDKEMMSRMLATLKDNNVVKAIACGSLTTVGNFQIADPQRIIPALSYPDAQHNSLPDTAEFVRYFQEKRFTVFGELGLQYEGKILSDPELEPYLSICERMAIPVAFHTGITGPDKVYTCCPKARSHLGNPQLIEDVLVKHPRMKIQLMHMGYPWLEETKAIMFMYPQVHADLGVINWRIPVAEFYNYLKSFIDAGFEKRIMFGSDQMAWADAIPLAIKTLRMLHF